ncbi:alpha/beta fold hydrolase [Ponticaulis profundi]|uniref:Alpha/beta fold hydrolase n=1 Tax=Ponticaulis profundi TaxID=2665222 RepID=A0ABW1S7C7_9PROT
MKSFAILSTVALVGTLVLASLTSAEPEANVKAPAYDAKLTEYEYPFEVRSYAFESQQQDLEMAYMYLPADAGQTTIVLMHGKNFNGAYWEETARYLNAKGYGVLIPDQIGFGKSSKPRAYQYSFNQLAANTRDLMTELGIEKAVILGHSMGGMVASRFALSYPEQTEKLVLVNPIGLEDYLDYTTYPTISDAYESELKKTGESIIAYQKKNYYDGAWNEDYEALTLPLRGWLNGPDKDTLAYVAALTYDMILTQPVVNDFSELTVPTSLILGTRDRTGPNRANKRDGVDYELGRYDELGETVTAMIPNADLIELDDLGHLPHIEAFDRFTPALDRALGETSAP